MLYDKYLNRGPRDEVDPDFLYLWCMRPVNPMIYYTDAPDQEKAPIIEENRARMEQDVLNCLDDPRVH